MGPILFDQPMMSAIQAWHPAWLTSLMKVITTVLMPEILAGVLVIIAGAMLVHQKQRRQGFLILMLTAGNIMTPLIKKLFERPRPDPSQAIVLIHETSFSFPSGHALGIVLFCSGILLLIPQARRVLHRRLAVVAVILSLLVGFSRVYLGVHWMTDVLAGYILAVAWLVVARWLVATVYTRRVRHE